MTYSKMQYIKIKKYYLNPFKKINYFMRKNYEKCVQSSRKSQVRLVEHFARARVKAATSQRRLFVEFRVLKKIFAIDVLSSMDKVVSEYIRGFNSELGSGG